MDKVNVIDKLSLFSDYGNQRNVGELNGQHVKLVKQKGKFIWHRHENKDELFYVVKGSLRMEFCDKTVVVSENELLIVPRGVEHRPVAEEEVHIMLFEPAATRNTGNVENGFTKYQLERI